MLIDYDFSEEDVDEYLNKIDSSIWKEKLSHIIEKRKKLMKNKSYFMFINKLKNDLYNLGYDRYLIDELLSNISYESDSLKKEYEKVSRKFKGERNKIISSLLRKGYTYEEINSFVKNDV